MTDNGATRTTTALTPDPLDAFASRVLSVPFGTLSKTETEFLVFRLLVEAGKIDLDSSEFVLSNRLLMTPARVRNLLYRYDQRVIESDPTQLAALVTAENTVIEAAVDTHHVRVRFRRGYLHEYVSTQLLRRNVIAEVTLTPGLMTVPIFDLFFVLRGASAGTAADADDDATEGADPRAEFDAVWDRFITAYDAGDDTESTRLRTEILKDHLPKALSTASGLFTIVAKVTDVVTKLLPSGAATP
ncbi:hypothetical protein ACPEEZ_09415 [Frigoribacterium sp. 2-23]|uniref:hypothetical protein n=1 Tax=Frigoribacterium sp. 2-23 TaxID=3415006 RepID=UPI003C6F0441